MRQKWAEIELSLEIGSLLLAAIAALFGWVHHRGNKQEGQKKEAEAKSKER